MGMHDVVRIVCPKCTSFVKVDSKAGDCLGRTYAMEKAPIDILAEVQYESQRGRIVCLCCGCDLAVVLNWSVAVRPLSDQREYDEDWEEIKHEEL